MLEQWKPGDGPYSHSGNIAHLVPRICFETSNTQQSTMVCVNSWHLPNKCCCLWVHVLYREHMSRCYDHVAGVSLQGRNGVLSESCTRSILTYSGEA